MLLLVSLPLTKTGACKRYKRCWLHGGTVSLTSFTNFSYDFSNKYVKQVPCTQISAIYNLCGNMLNKYKVL